MTSQSPTTFKYETLPGYFIQSDPGADPSAVGPNPPAFGLKNRGSESYWTEFKIQIGKLQSNAPKGVRYGVCWFGRHGEGFHNVGEALYGTTDWDNYWSCLDTDGKLVWGPDAELTDLGRDQARGAAKVWETELARSDPVPFPTKIFSSPLTRAAETLQITFSNVSKPSPVRPYVIEDLREMIGVHTCDKRRSKSFTQARFPGYDIEPGFTEEDELWSPSWRETDEEMEPRLKRALDKIFGSLLEENETYFSITAHSGTIAASLRVLGHQEYRLPTGGVIPVVIRATQAK